MRVIVVTPIKINKAPFERDRIIDIEDEAIAEQLLASRAVRRIQTVAEIEHGDIVRVPISAGVIQTVEGVVPTSKPIAEQTFEQWCSGGGDPRNYPPSGYLPQDTAAWRAYQVVTTTQTMGREMQPQRAVSNPGFHPVVREMQ